MSSKNVYANARLTISPGECLLKNNSHLLSTLLVARSSNIWVVISILQMWNGGSERLTLSPKVTHLIKNISIFFDIMEEEREGGKKGGREGEMFLNPHDPHALPSFCSHL